MIQYTFSMKKQGRPGFQARGAYLKKLRRAEGGANIYGVFRVKNHDFNTKKSNFFPILGEDARRVPPPLDPPLRRVY